MSVHDAIPRAVFDQLLEGCQVVGYDWRYLYVNDAIVTQAGRSREELIGQTMMACYPGIDATPMFAELRRCMLERTPGEMENEFAYPDGTRLVFQLRFVPVPDGVCVLSLDITEKRHPLSAIVNASSDAIIGRGLDGVITSWNDGAQRMYGYTAGEMIGRGIGVLFPASRRDEEAVLVDRIARGERVDHFETVRLRKDRREIDVAVTLSPVRDASGALIGISKIGRDITELKRVQREVERARERAETANRELEAFSYSVAHDLRAPLRSIDGFSQALLEDYAGKLDDDGRKYLRFVRESAQLMAQLIDDILTLSRVTRQELLRAEADLSALARACCARLAQRDPDRRVEVSIEEGLVGHGDRRLLAVVLENLLGNAWKFTSKREQPRIAFGATTQGGERVFFVRDNGAGFDMAYASKLFGLFQRLHSAGEFEGTGVGLATVQRIVHRHGGRVSAEGAVDGGATFTFTLGNPELPA